MRLVRHRYPGVVRFPYPRLVERVLASHEADQDGVWPTVCPRWDNSPRRPRGAVVLTDSSPAAYEEWLRCTLLSTDKPFVFVNSWNEWGEGAHLEPDDRWAHRFLEATLRARDGARLERSGERA